MYNKLHFEIYDINKENFVKYLSILIDCHLS